MPAAAARRVPEASERWSVVGWIQSRLPVSEDPVGGTRRGASIRPGRRDAWANSQPQDPAEIMMLDLGRLVVTQDCCHDYTWHRAESDLYLVEGWADRTK